MLAIALVSLSLAVAPNPPPSAQKPDAIETHPGKAAPTSAPAHSNDDLSPIQSQTPPGVLPSGTVDRLHLDRQRQISSGAARQAGADSHPEPACTRREARAGRCVLRPGKPSTRSGDSTPGASDITPPVTPP